MKKYEKTVKIIKTEKILKNNEKTEKSKQIWFGLDSRPSKNPSIHVTFNSFTVIFAENYWRITKQIALKQEDLMRQCLPQKELKSSKSRGFIKEGSLLLRRMKKKQSSLIKSPKINSNSSITSDRK